jgi:iron complex transport system ATP-binding protein
LARALATESRILLADEPAAGLDPRHQLDMMRTLRDRATAGTACCIVLHDLSLAAQHCDRVVLLNRGRVVGEGAANKVLTDAMLDAVYGVRVARFATAIVPVASSGGPAR